MAENSTRKPFLHHRGEQQRPHRAPRRQQDDGLRLGLVRQSLGQNQRGAHHRKHVLAAGEMRPRSNGDGFQPFERSCLDAEPVSDLGNRRRLGRAQPDNVERQPSDQRFGPAFVRRAQR
jgi:hypothetical protein